MENLRFIQYKHSQIAYHVYGSGKAAVFCLHGFSLSGIAYFNLGKLCPRDKIMFALDFPLHGATTWLEPDLQPDDLLQIFGLIYQQELLQPLTLFQLMGHSMGGRICLFLYQQYASQISQLILLAPDGLSPTFGNRFLFKTSLGPKLFRRMSNSSNLIMSLAFYFRKIGLINRSVFNLIKSSYEDTDTAHLVYSRLMITHHFYPDMAKIKRNIRIYKTPVYLFFGKYDSIVPATLANHIQKKDESFAQVKILLCGHLILASQETLPDIAAVL